MKENLSQQGKSVRRRMQAEQARQHRDRDNARWRRFLFANFIKPGTISTAALLLFSFILFEFAGLIKSTLVACIHFSIVAFLLFLLWMPNFIEICPWLARRRKIIMLVRNLLCFLFVITLFPYQLLLMYIGSGSLFNLALTMLGVGLLILLIVLVARSEKARNWSYIFISRNNMKKVSLRGMSKLIMYLYIVFSFFIIELWFVSQL
ncbi:MAG: hypothetical protein ACE5I1_07370, partial [bacterium]